MTCIAAIVESETSLLVAADSGAHDNGLCIKGQLKLRTRPGRPFVWGNAGNQALGLEFDEWILSRPVDETWREFREAAADELARLNGVYRRRAVLAGTQPSTQHDAGHALFVSWADGPQILEINDRGAPTSYVADRFHAIGSGGNIAKIAYLTLRPFSMPTVEERFKWIMTVAAELAQQSDPPIHIKRVTADGVVDL